MVMVAGRVFAVTVVEECHSVLVLATVGVHWTWNKTHPSTHSRQLAVLNTHTALSRLLSCHSHVVLIAVCVCTQIRSVYRHIGVCPQFDIQHSNLTAKEVCGSWSAAMFSDVMFLFIVSNHLLLLPCMQHLLFYARLRGVRWRSEKAVVKEALTQVGGRVRESVGAAIHHHHSCAHFTVTPSTSHLGAHHIPR